MQLDQVAVLPAQLNNDTWRVRLAWLLCGATIALSICGVGLLLSTRLGDHRDLLGIVYACTCALTGTFITSRRSRNLVGWLLTVAGLCVSGGFTVIQYGLHGWISHPGSLPLPLQVAWISTLVVPVGTGLPVLLLPLVFPNGRLISPAWRVVAWLLVGFIVVVTGLNTIRVGNIQSLLPNPFAIVIPEPWNTWSNYVTGVVLIVLVALCLASIVVRYQRADGDQRLQIKWLAFAIFIWFFSAIVSSIVELFSKPLFVIADTVVFLAFLFIPVSIGVAVLRYRLYNIEVLINRTLVYGILTTGVVGVYILVVTALGALLAVESNSFVGLVATGLVAVVFQPLRVRVQRAINRLLYGERDEPYTALSRLGQRLEATLAPEAVLPTLVQTVAETLKLPYTAIRLPTTVNRKPTNDERDWTIAAEHGRLTAGAPTMLETLIYQGEFVGQFVLAPRRGAVFTAADQHLLRELARQAGAAVYTVQLTAALQARMLELRRSREQLVTAQEEERRRIQRDLHDGLGPVLASMRFRLEACLDQAQVGPPELIADLERLDELVGQATTDIRRLVYDLRPPALDQVGLSGALTQYITRVSRETGLEILLDADVPEQLPAASEVTIYRAVQEGLVNTAKYGHATTVNIRLATLGQALLLSIADDGVGGAQIGQYDTGGNGLMGMRERAELLGGTLVVHSLPNAGTTLELYLPLRGMNYGSDNAK